jgi:predicted P-loop ATPase/GTPase
MNILVAGSARVDAGKTTFAVGFLERTGAVGFKPRAGNDYWFDHDDYRLAVDQGRLFGADARKLAAASPGTRDPEAINPIHRLWRPSPRGGSGLLGREDREFVLDRVGDRYVVNDTQSIPMLAREQLGLDGAVRVDSLSEFNDAMASLHVPAQRSLLEEVAAADRALVESYADVARPTRDLEPDAVAVVEPGRVRLFDGRRYVKACEVAAGGPTRGQLEERVPNVTDLVDPVTEVALAPLTSEQRADPGAVADRYESAYDGLLSVAGW